MRVADGLLAHVRTLLDELTLVAAAPDGHWRCVIYANFRPQDSFFIPTQRLEFLKRNRIASICRAELGDGWLMKVIRGSGPRPRYKGGPQSARGAID